MLRLSGDVEHVEDTPRRPLPGTTHYAADYYGGEVPRQVVRLAERLVQSLAQNAAEQGVTLDWTTARIEADYNPAYLADKLVVKATALPAVESTAYEGMDGRFYRTTMTQSTVAVSNVD